MQCHPICRIKDNISHVTDIYSREYIWGSVCWQLACFFKVSVWVFSSFISSVTSFRSPSSQSVMTTTCSHTFHCKDGLISTAYVCFLQTHQTSQRGTRQSWCHFCKLLSSCRCNLFLTLEGTKRKVLRLPHDKKVQEVISS